MACQTGYYEKVQFALGCYSRENNSRLLTTFQGICKRQIKVQKMADQNANECCFFPYLFSLQCEKRPKVNLETCNGFRVTVCTNKQKSVSKGMNVTRKKIFVF